MIRPLKSLTKSALGLLARRSSWIQETLDQGLTVFVYHDVTDRPAPFSRECGLALAPRLFERQIRFIADNFRVISLDQLLGDQVPERAALITFDDGLRNLFHEALPILRRMGLPSTVFLNMGPVSGDPFWSARVVYLCRHVSGFREFAQDRKGALPLEQMYGACSPELVAEWEKKNGEEYLKRLTEYGGLFAAPEDLRQADSEGLVTFGNHGYNHYGIRQLSEAQLEQEFQTNAEALSRLRGHRPVFAFPFGRPAQRQVEQLLRWGQKRLFTGFSLINSDREAPVLHRLSLTPWHHQPSRIWYEIAQAARNGIEK